MYSSLPVLRISLKPSKEKSKTLYGKVTAFKYGEYASMIIGERDNYRMLAVSASTMQTLIKGVTWEGSEFSKDGESKSRHVTVGSRVKDCLMYLRLKLQ